MPDWAQTLGIHDTGQGEAREFWMNPFSKSKLEQTNRRQTSAVQDQNKVSHYNICMYAYVFCRYFIAECNWYSLRLCYFLKGLKVFHLHTRECFAIYSRYLHCVQWNSLQALNCWVLSGTVLASCLHAESNLWARN